MWRLSTEAIFKSDLTQMSMDPYVYTIDERGNRVYNVFNDNINLYQCVGTFDLETFAVVGRTQFSGSISEDYKTFLKYVLTYEVGRQTKKALWKTDIDYIKDFIANNIDSITVISAEVWEYFQRTNRMGFEGYQLQRCGYLYHKDDSTGCRRCFQQRVQSRRRSESKEGF